MKQRLRNKKLRSKPIYPEKNTLAHFALLLLLDGKLLSSDEFSNLTASKRLAAYIHDLRKLGWNIQSHRKPAPSRMCPWRKICFYFLPVAIIETAGGKHE